MRIITSFLLLLITFLSFSQRVSFEDPDLTFSFVKPENWEVFDDGYVVKVSPPVRDSASVYFTITYFENAQPLGSFPRVQSANETNDTDSKTIKIDGEIAEKRKKDASDAYSFSYTFMKFGQRFEIETTAPNSKSKRIFRKILRSIEIKE